MVNYEFDKTRGDYINYTAAPDDLIKDNNYSAFPHKLSGHEDTDVTAEQSSFFFRVGHSPYKKVIKSNFGYYYR